SADQFYTEAQTRHNIFSIPIKILNCELCNIQQLFETFLNISRTRICMENHRNTIRNEANNQSMQYSKILNPNQSLMLYAMMFLNNTYLQQHLTTFSQLASRILLLDSSALLTYT